MAKIYADLIIAGRKEIDDVPLELKASVLAILKAKGFVIE